MNVLDTPLRGLKIVEPRVLRDARGFFLETYREDRYRDAGIAATFMQANHSRSVRGTLRGLHWQEGRHPQAKLVRAIVGDIFDVAVDLRPASETFGRWFGIHMRADNFRQLYIPEGFAHGFCVLSEIAEIEYLCSAPYDPAGERGVMWNDPDLAIAWPLEAPLLSDRDQRHPTLRELPQARALAAV